jgi:hypothetical protein
MAKEIIIVYIIIFLIDNAEIILRFRDWKHPLFSKRAGMNDRKEKTLKGILDKAVDNKKVLVLPSA